jgi:transcriptional regulator with XRE-family HTH domain
MQWSDEAVDQLYKAIGDQIQAARARSRMTQTELAQRVGRTRSSIANIEAGRQRAMIHTLLQIADVLGVALRELVPERDSASHTNTPLSSDTLDGQPPTTHDFVTAALRRASGE